MKHDFTNKHSENESHLDVCLVPAGLRLTITTHTAISGWFNPAQAPAIALAILEAAGVEPSSPHYGLNDSPEWNLRWASHYLGRSIELTNTQTAEARERAELEAEAFKLRKAYLEGRTGFDSWNELTDAEREQWLAVARRAREMRAEK